MDKALIVTSTFPASGGSRVDKFVKFLPRHGFEPVVLSAAETYSPKAQKLMKALYPDELKAYRAESRGWSYFTERYLDRGPDAWDYNLLRVLSWPERLLYQPDRMVRWIDSGTKLAEQLVRDENIRVVFTSSPPESTHLIGLRLKEDLGLPWVADFRDLWTERTRLYRPATRFHDRAIRRLEEQVFKTADHVIANTPENAARYASRFGFGADRLSTIPNGFDLDDLPAEQPERSPNEVFTIGHAGNLDKHNYPWREFLDAFKLLADEVGRDKVRFSHCGFYSRRVEAYLHKQGLSDLVENHGMLPHQEAMSLVDRADVRLLLLLESEYSSAIVPMKLYNYLMMGGPIMAIAPEQGEVASIVQRTATGNVVSPTRSPASICKHLRQFYDEWQTGSVAYQGIAAEIEKFNRDKQAGTLASVFRSLL